MIGFALHTARAVTHGVIRTVLGEKRLYALADAIAEYHNAIEYDDWRERKDIFGAIDVFDSAYFTHPGDKRAKDGYYFVVERLKDLNDRRDT